MHGAEHSLICVLYYYMLKWKSGRSEIIQKVLHSEEGTRPYTEFKKAVWKPFAYPLTTNSLERLEQIKSHIVEENLEGKVSLRRTLSSLPR